ASLDSGDGYGLETRYLINTLGEVLRTYVTELVIKRPADPIEYLARSLKHHAAMEKSIAAELTLDEDEVEEEKRAPKSIDVTETPSLTTDANQLSSLKSESQQNYSPEEIMAEKIVQEILDDKTLVDDSERFTEVVPDKDDDDDDSGSQKLLADKLDEDRLDDEGTDTIGEMKIDPGDRFEDGTELTMDETMVADSLDFDDVQPNEMVDPEDDDDDDDADALQGAANEQQ
ncbi:hypothetical protein FBUS_06770, partial [Fasciolopsis buskii]